MKSCLRTVMIRLASRSPSENLRPWPCQFRPDNFGFISSVTKPHFNILSFVTILILVSVVGTHRERCKARLTNEQRSEKNSANFFWVGTKKT